MANKWLIGNGYWCKSCRSSGVSKVVTDVFEYGDGSKMKFFARCSVCNGSKRIAAGSFDIMQCRVPKTRRPSPSSMLEIIRHFPAPKQGS